MLTGWKAFAENTGYRVADEILKKTGRKGNMGRKIENRNIDVTKPEANWKKIFWNMSTGCGGKADRSHRKSMPEK